VTVKEVALVKLSDAEKVTEHLKPEVSSWTDQNSVWKCALCLVDTFNARLELLAEVASRAAVDVESADK